MSALTELSNVLWAERRAIERLLYRLEVQQLVLTSGRARWIAAAAKDVEAVMDKIREAELIRAVHTGAVSRELGLATAEPSLSDLVAAAPSPWDAILRDHQEAFLSMTSEADTLSKANAELLQRGFVATREYMHALQGGGALDGYSSSGTTQRFGLPSHLVDTSF
jgi:FlgN protein